MDPTPLIEPFSLMTVSRWAAGTVGVEEMEAAISNFKRARQLNKVTPDMYNALLGRLIDEGLTEKAADLISTSEVGEMEMAISHFKRARELKRATPDMYNALVNKLIDSGLVKKAADLIYEDNINITASTYNDTDLLELGQFSYGVAIFLLEQYIDSNPWSTRFSIRLKDGHEQFKQYVCDNFLNWECRTDTKNNDIVIINKKLSKKELGCIGVINKIFSSSQEVTRNESQAVLMPSRQTGVRLIKEFCIAIDSVGKNIFDKRPNAHIVNLLMEKKLPTKDLELKKYLFSIARENRSVDSKTYELFMKAAAEVKNFSAIQWALEEAKKDKQIRPETYETFISIAGKFRKFAELKKRLVEAEQADLATTEVYNAAIIGLGGENLLDAQKIFENLKSEKRDVGTTYAAMLQVVKKQNQLPLLSEILDEAIKANQCDDSVVTTFMEVTKGSEKFREAETLFWKSQKTDNGYKALMEALSETGNHSEVKRVFNWMKSTKTKISPWANSFFAESIYKEGEYNVLKFFETFNTRTMGQVPPNMYSLLLKEMAAEQNIIEKIDNEQFYFRRGHSQWVLESSTYVSMIKVAINIHDIAKIIHFLNLAKTNNMNTKRVYNVCIDGLLKHRCFDTAGDIYKEAGFSVDVKRKKGINIVDLRGLSHGAGLMALGEFISKTSLTMFKILPGNNIAKHSSEYNPYNAENYRDHIGRFFASSNWICKPDPTDENLLIMKLRNERR